MIGGAFVFGYVNAHSPELRVRENEYYKGAYCGLCKAMGRCTGQCSRLSLSYDILALALARIAISGERTAFYQKRCIAHPFKKRNVMKGNKELDYSSRVLAILSYYKVKDDVADGGFWKKAVCRIFLLPWASAAKKRAIKSDPSLSELDRICAEKIGVLSNMERDRISSVDMPAKAFGELLGEMFAFSFEGSERRLAYDLGLHIGRWIYIADALDDMEEDMRTGNYNPLLRIYGGELPTKEQADDIALALKNELFSAEAAADLIDFGENDTVKNILFNILYLGMPNRIKNIIAKFENKTDERTDRR